MIEKIKVGTLELSAENGYFVSAIRDLGYKTKYPVSSVLAVHGAKLGNAYFQNRTIVVEMKIGASTAIELIAKRSALYEQLTIQEFGEDLIVFQVTLANGIVLQATGIIKDVTADLVAGNVGICDVSFAIEMEQPFFKSTQIYEQKIPITEGGGAAIPMAVPLAMTAGATGFSTVSNGGNIFVYPDIYFYGALTNPVLTNETMGKELAIDDTIATGYYKVDTYNHVVVDETVANVRDKMTGDFLILQVGDNLFSLLTDSGADDGYVIMRYQNFFISI
jgi:hypothetical protein